TQSASVAPKQTPPDINPEERDADSGATRSVTPSYQARKPTVRTLQSTSSSSTPTAANLHVGRGLKLEGKIQSCDSLVIEGDVQATIESGTLTISETGDVRGEATVDAAEINGKFDGTLTVKKCLTINSSGRVTGTVHYGELKVEQGGQVSGEIRAQSADDASEKPRLASSGGKDENKSGDSSTISQGNSSSRSASMI
ncbi:MAG: polymer-forming cytoskeletal protein, partial [Parvibaculum sp.]|nr:polymer-forming cytoskeletal protein [Parvibaculum sp.]